MLSTQIIFLKIFKSYVPNQQPNNVHPHQPYWVTSNIIYTSQAKQPYNNHYQKPRNKPSLHEVFDNGVVPRLSNNGKYNSHAISPSLLPVKCSHCINDYLFQPYCCDGTVSARLPEKVRRSCSCRPISGGCILETIIGLGYCRIRKLWIRNSV